MKQIIQNLRSGETSLIETPAPVVEPGHVLIHTRRSLVSQGTEKMLVQFGRASLFQKARSQPDRVRQVLAKIRTDGLMPTIEAVFRRLDEPMPLGYCNAGVVIAVGEGVDGFAIGDRVASNGPHAEVVSVPANLVAKVPAEVSDDAAAFTVIGAVALQGLRLAKPELGETFVVSGLGLVGQLTAQLLQAAGCRVIGLDLDPAKLEVARRCGVVAANVAGEMDPVQHVLGLTGGIGADGVIITASTSSHEVVAQSARMSRKRGRIVLVGVVGLNLNRSDFYEKELSFQVSCSYGPGRYETAYEEKGLDYPIGQVRWTENRNFQAVLGAMATGGLNVEPLITRRVPLAECAAVYSNMDSGLASLLVYDAAGDVDHITTVQASSSPGFSGGGALAIVGAGNFAKMTAIPALCAAHAPIKAVVSGGGISGTALARKYRIPISTTDYDSVLRDPEIGGVIITTRHNLHATQTLAALKAGKHVLVEKPLCLTRRELREIENQVSADKTTGATVTVGFNRRFSPHAEQMRGLLAERAHPVSLILTMNAGAVPSGHWVHDPEIGGGRLLGEACHFIDLAQFLTGSRIEAVSAVGLKGAADCASILLRHADGSTAVVNYLANGHREVSKERIEVFAAGRSLLLDNFRELTGFGFKRFSKLKTRQDKGHQRQFALFAERVRAGGSALIPWSEIANSMRATFAALLSLERRNWVDVDEI